MASKAALLVGREAIRKNWMDLTKFGIRKFTLTAQDVAQSGSLTVERGTYVLDVTPGPKALIGMAAFQDRGNYLVQWRLEGGRWSIVNDISTIEIPIPTTNK
jgi:ketosteroid isomerase-like protein